SFSRDWSSDVCSSDLAGRTKVRATAGDKTTEVAVTVDPVPAVPVDTVVVSPSPASVREGSTVQLSAVTRDPDGKVLSGRAITWEIGRASCRERRRSVV